jgi:hypothetical protein
MPNISRGWVQRGGELAPPAQEGRPVCPEPIHEADPAVAFTALKRPGPGIPFAVSQPMRFGLLNPSTEFRQLAGPR